MSDVTATATNNRGSYITHKFLSFAALIFFFGPFAAEHQEGGEYGQGRQNGCG